MIGTFQFSFTEHNCFFINFLTFFASYPDTTKYRHLWEKVAKSNICRSWWKSSPTWDFLIKVTTHNKLQSPITLSHTAFEETDCPFFASVYCELARTRNLDLLNSEHYTPLAAREEIYLASECTYPWWSRVRGRRDPNQAFPSVPRLHTKFRHSLPSIVQWHSPRERFMS